MNGHITAFELHSQIFDEPAGGVGPLGDGAKVFEQVRRAYTCPPLELRVRDALVLCEGWKRRDEAPEALRRVLAHERSLYTSSVARAAAVYWASNAGGETGTASPANERIQRTKLSIRRT